MVRRLVFGSTIWSFGSSWQRPTCQNIKSLTAVEVKTHSSYLKIWPSGQVFKCEKITFQKKMCEETITSEFTFKTKKKYLISLPKQISYLLGLRKKMIIVRMVV